MPLLPSYLEEIGVRQMRQSGNNRGLGLSFIRPALPLKSFYAV